METLIIILILVNAIIITVGAHIYTSTQNTHVLKTGIILETITICTHILINNIGYDRATKSIIDYFMQMPAVFFICFLLLGIVFILFLLLIVLCLFETAIDKLNE